MKKWREKIKHLREERAKTAPESMTEEQREQHEKYLAELTAQNQSIVRKITMWLWCGAMVGWTIFIVLDVLFPAGPIKLLFHIVGALLTAVLALPRAMDFFARRKKSKNEPHA